MSDSETDPLRSLLGSFALGPSWAKATGGQTGGNQEQQPRRDSERGERQPSRGEKFGAPRGDSPRDRQNGPRDDHRRDGGKRPFERRDGKPADRRSGPPRQEEIGPAEGVRVILVPDAEAVHLIGKEIHQVARVYPLFDVAKILLAERGRCRASFEAVDPGVTLYAGKTEPCLFLTREEALRHLWNSSLRDQFIEEETIDVDPPTGNFQVVARCGISGEWLGPPNFHAYQINLRRLHRERFPNMPFAAYSSKVRTERGEEAVNAWLETMKKKTRWRIKGDGDDAWLDNLADAERALASRCFDQAFDSVRRVELNAAIDPKSLSPSLFVSLKMAGNHARNHPAVLIPAVCKAVEAEHLPVFKRQGKLFTGPARPQALPLGATLAERPGIMVEWIRANKPAKLEGLWKAVLPEGGTAPPAEFAADLFWLLHQGHILLFTDDTLVVQEVREPQANEPQTNPKAGKKRKAKGRKSETTAPDAPNPAAVSPIAETPATEAPKPETPAPETPVPEAPRCEVPSPEPPHPEAPPIEAPQPETPQCETPHPEALLVEVPTPELPTCETPVSEVPQLENPPCEPPTPEAPVFNDPVTEPPQTKETLPNDPVGPSAEELSSNSAPRVDESGSL